MLREEQVGPGVGVLAACVSYVVMRACGLTPEPRAFDVSRRSERKLRLHVAGSYCP